MPKYPGVKDARMLNVVFCFLLPPHILHHVDFDWIYTNSFISRLQPTAPQTNSD